MPDDRIILGYVARVRHGGYRRVELDALDAGGFQAIHIVQHDAQVFIADPGVAAAAARAGAVVAASIFAARRFARSASKRLKLSITRTFVCSRNLSRKAPGSSRGD